MKLPSTEHLRASQRAGRRSLFLALMLCVAAASASAQDRDGDGFPDASDVCPYTFDDQSDSGGVGVGSGPDGIGDACQCGDVFPADVGGDGVVTPEDGAFLAEVALGLDPTYTLAGFPAFTKCDVGGTEGCSGLDASLVTRASLGLSPIVELQQVCAAAVLTPTNNLSLGSNPVSLVGLTEIVTGHTNVLQVRLEADEPTTDVAIQFFLVDKAAADASSETDLVPQYLVGSTILATLNAGQSVVEVQLEIPADDLDGNPIVSGEYYLYPVIDPAQELFETDEDDNVPPQSDFAIVTVTDAYLDADSILVEDVVLDFSSFELPQVLAGYSDPDDPCPGGVEGPRYEFGELTDLVLNRPNTSLSVSAIVRRTGPTGSTQEFRLRPSIDHPRFVGSGPCPTGACPVLVWNGSEYVNEISIGRVQTGATDENPTSIQVDVRVPTTPEFQTLFNDLLTDIQTECEAACAPGDALCVSACTLADLAQGTVQVEVVPPPGGLVFNNPVLEFDVDRPVTILPPRFVPPPTPTSPIRFEEGFETGFSAKFAGAGLRANAWAALDGTGASAHAEAAVPITLFGQEFEFLGLDADGAAYPGRLDLGFSLDLRFAGIVLYSQLLDDETCALDLNQRGDLSVGGLANELLNWKLDFFVEKSKGAAADFVVGIVPLTAAFEASGKLGFLVEAGLPVCDAGYADTFFRAHTGPYLDVGMLASAGVGTSKGFSAGIEGQATLVEDTFFARAQVDALELLPTPARVSGTVIEQITNELVGPSGGVNLYVGYPCIKFCRWFGIPYPCGVSQCKARKSIFRFSSFVKEDVLMCESATSEILVP